MTATFSSLERRPSCASEHLLMLSSPTLIVFGTDHPSMMSSPECTSKRNPDMRLVRYQTDSMVMQQLFRTLPGDLADYQPRDLQSAFLMYALLVGSDYDPVSIIGLLFAVNACSLLCESPAWTEGMRIHYSLRNLSLPGAWRLSEEILPERHPPSQERPGSQRCPRPVDRAAPTSFGRRPSLSWRQKVC